MPIYHESLFPNTAGITSHQVQRELITKEQIRELVETANESILVYLKQMKYTKDLNVFCVMAEEYFYSNESYSIQEDYKQELYDAWASYLKIRLNDKRILLTADLRHLFYRNNIYIKGNDPIYGITSLKVQELIEKASDKLLEYILCKNKKFVDNPYNYERINYLSWMQPMPGDQHNTDNAWSAFRKKHIPILALWIAGWIVTRTIPVTPELIKLFLDQGIVLTDARESEDSFPTESLL